MPQSDDKASLLSALRIDPSQRDDHGRPQRWPWILMVAVAACVALGAWFRFGHPAVVVETALAQAVVAADTSRAVLEATGYVTARRESTVSSKITGKLSEVLIEEGDHVKAGQVLARLDDTDARAQLQVSRAQLEAARARMGELQAQLEQARLDLTRQEDLRARGLTAQQLLDSARTQEKSLASQLAVQKRQIQVAEAQLQVAEVNYDNTIIRAPYDGVIVAKAAQPGEIVSPISAGGGFTRTGIGTIVDMDSLEIEVDVNESYINRVTPGQPVEAVLDAYPGWKIPGEVIAIIPTADRSKATVKVRIAMKSKDPRIVPDMGVRVSYLEEASPGEVRKTSGVTVPAAAVVQRDGREVVFVVEDDHASRRQVTAAPAASDPRLIEQGLVAGERVILSPPAVIKDGVRVEVRGGAS